MDLPDTQLYRNPLSAGNTVVNEMESVAELVTECVMDMDNAFPEQQNDDHNSNSTAKKVQQLKFHEIRVQLPQLIHAELAFTICPAQINFNSEFINEITPPPPKA